jgi:hypothetical protein
MTDRKACELMGEMRRLEAGGWRLEAGGWRLEAGGGIYDKEVVSGSGDCFCYRT